MSDTIDLIEAEIPHLRRYARYLTRDLDRADDVVQDALVRAIANVAKWQPGTNMRAWLFVIVRNTFINERRRSSRNIADGDFEAATLALGVPANQENAFYLTELARVFENLPSDHQEVLLFVVVEGMTYEEAAEILEVPLGTVRSRLSRARDALRKSLDGDHADSIQSKISEMPENKKGKPPKNSENGQEVIK